MKSVNLAALLGMLLFIFTACQKEEITPSLSSKEILERANAQPVITFNPNPGIVGENVTVSLEFGTCGQGQLQEEIPVGSGDWFTVVGNTNAGAGNPDITYNFVPSQDGTCAYKFRAVVSGGQNCTAYTGAQPGVCLEVINPCDIQPGDYFTYSQGFYLNSPVGAQFLADHPELGPVEVGCEAGTTTSYTLDEIVAMESGNSTAPGILVKQIITMTLNISAALGSEDDLGCLVVVADGNAETTLDDLFEGMTVSEILDEANNLAGGCGSSFSSEDLANVLGLIVANFHEGAVNNGLLTCCE